MAGADDYDFDIAVSFAGEHREYVTELVGKLHDSQIRVFLDSEHLSESWGENLPEFFDGIYRKQSRFAMLFISPQYRDKEWTRLERRSAIARAVTEHRAYILPVIMEPADIDGLPPTIGHIDARYYGLDRIAELAVRKVRGVTASPLTGDIIDRTPRTDAEREALLLDTPPGWEYLLFAAELLRWQSEYQSAFLDYEMGYAAVGERVENVLTFISSKIGEIAHLIATLDGVMQARNQDAAFGAPGIAGDRNRIERLAARWASVYGEILSWVASIRGAVLPESGRNIREALVRYAEQPIAAYRAFVEEFVAFVDKVPAALRNGEHLHLAQTVTIEVPDDVARQMDAAMRQYERAENA